MAKRIILLMLSLCILLPVGMQAQKKMSWKKHRKAAEKAEEKGDYAEAAENYYAAFIKKKKKKELAYKAAEAYYTIREYEKAEEAYSAVKDETEDYPLVGLKYARCLKLQGKYDEASQEFLQFYNEYEGQNKTVLQEIIQVEIRGCDLGRNLRSGAANEPKIVNVGGEVNSQEMDFAPFAYRDDVLYYSTTKDGKAKIYTSKKEGNKWAKGNIPQNFPLIQNEHFCNGTFSPDANRFYFTICDNQGNWNTNTSRCEIFVIKKDNASWSQPVKLPDIINIDGYTSTHPNIVHQGGMEILYYASNREGGQGGMDLWYATRDLGNDDINFSYPVNLGPTINTLGDEITPFFDNTNGMLFFSSNGQISIGGFDIFKSRGSHSNWNVPVNIGMPFNSSTDDYYYVQGIEGDSYGFLVSNRNSRGGKNSTIDDDILSFGAVENRLLSLAGNVYDQDSGEPVMDVELALYEVNGTSEKLWLTNRFNDGMYRAELLPNRTFRVEVQSMSYIPSSYQFSTDDPNKEAYGEAIYLKKISQADPEDGGLDDPIVVAPPDPNEGVEDENDFDGGGNNLPPVSSGLQLIEGSNAGEEYTMRGPNYQIRTSAPRYRGTYYKVQLIAVKNFNPGSSSYASLQGLGTLNSEFLVERSLHRVLLGSYASLEEAQIAMEQARANGFNRAFMVEYQDGERVKRVR